MGGISRRTFVKLPRQPRRNPSNPVQNPSGGVVRASSWIVRSGTQRAERA